MKKLINNHYLGLFFITLLTWVISVSLSNYNADNHPKLYKNTNGSNGDIISINQDGIWTLNETDVSLWNEFGDIQQTITKPINTCDRFLTNDTFIGFYGRCGNAFYKIRKNIQPFALIRTNHSEMMDLCIADSHLVAVNHNALVSYRNLKEDYVLKVYTNKSDANGYVINQSQSKSLINCFTYCEMKKGEVFYIDSNNGDIKRITFNDANISIQNFANVFEKGAFVYYKLNKLSETEMSLMIENKMYLIEIASQGLILKSVIE
jgi:hypothetical protein